MINASLNYDQWYDDATIHELTEDTLPQQSVGMNHC